LHHELTKEKNIKIIPPVAKWFSWGLVVLTAVVTVWLIGDGAHELTAGQVSLWELLGELSFRLFPIIFAILAALVINRQLANLIGWLMALPVFGGIITFITESYFQSVVVPPLRLRFFSS
jgi:hypothetical protein